MECPPLLERPQICDAAALLLRRRMHAENEAQVEMPEEMKNGLCGFFLDEVPSESDRKR
jgi:hypothetical protein